MINIMINIYIISGEAFQLSHPKPNPNLLNKEEKKNEMKREVRRGRGNCSVLWSLLWSW